MYGSFTYFHIFLNQFSSNKFIQILNYSPELIKHQIHTFIEISCCASIFMHLIYSVFLCFRRTLGDSPKTLWKLSADGKSPHQNIRRNSENLRSGSYICYYLLMSFYIYNFSIKYVSYDSLKILLSSRIAKNDITFKLGSYITNDI